MVFQILEGSYRVELLQSRRKGYHSEDLRKIILRIFEAAEAQPTSLANKVPHGIHIITGINVDFSNGTIILTCAIPKGKPLEDIQKEIREAVFGPYKWPEQFNVPTEDTEYNRDRLDWDAIEKANWRHMQRLADSVEKKKEEHGHERAD